MHSDDKLVHLVARGFAARDRLIAVTGEELASMPENEFRHLERIARLGIVDHQFVSTTRGTCPFLPNEARLVGEDIGLAVCMLAHAQLELVGNAIIASRLAFAARD